MPVAGWPSLFWTAFKRSHNAMVVLDNAHRHVEVNGAYLVLLGYPRQRLIGRSIQEFLEGGRLMTEAQWRALPTTDNLGDTVFVRADGDHVKVQYAVHPEHVTGRRLVLVVALTTSRRHQPRRTRVRARGAEALTPRELQIIGLVALGHTGREIADELHISHDTVRTHITHAQNKLGARSRAQLVALTIGEGYFAETLDVAAAVS
jgi:PAS domain S-box-containing protein